MMLIYSVQLGAIAVIASFFMRRCDGASTGRARRHGRADHPAAKQQSHFLGNRAGVQSVRLFGRAEERRMGWMNMLAEQFNADLRIQRIGITYQTPISSLRRGARDHRVAGGARRARPEFLVGMLFAFIAYKASSPAASLA